MILAAKGSTRRRFRIVAVYERDTGDLLAEAVHTGVGPVVVIHYADSRVVPLRAPNQRLHLKTRLRGKSTEPGALAFFDGTAYGPLLGHRRRLHHPHLTQRNADLPLTLCRIAAPFSA